jgi:hypothetical protein
MDENKLNSNKDLIVVANKILAGVPIQKKESLFLKRISSEVGFFLNKHYLDERI